MKPTKVILALTAAALMLFAACQDVEPSFAHVKDGKFVCKDYPSHFLGTNFWY
jgi:hypothetical protein